MLRQSKCELENNFQAQGISEASEFIKSKNHR